MLSETLQHGLRNYSIGEKVRELRLRKKMGLVELGKHSGLSPALLSKIERGHLFPTLPTLLRISLVFSVGLGYFFADDQSRHAFAVMRKKDRQRFALRPGAKKGEAPIFECLDFNAVERKINAYFAEFPHSRGKAFVHDHQGIEFIHVLSGRLVVSLREDETALDAGDSIYFDSTVPHGYRREGSRRCTGIVITAQ